jgi:microsomal dipeptidase-like Zn-dependent dipeptidase
MQKHTTTKTLNEVLYKYNTGCSEKIRDYGNEKCSINVSISAVKNPFGEWISTVWVNYNWDDDDGGVHFNDSFYAHDRHSEIDDLMQQILYYIEKYSLGEVGLGMSDFNITREEDASNIGFWRMEEDAADVIKDFLIKECVRLEREYSE